MHFLFHVSEHHLKNGWNSQDAKKSLLELRTLYRASRQAFSSAEIQFSTACTCSKNGKSDDEVQGSVEGREGAKERKMIRHRRTFSNSASESSGFLPLSATAPSPPPPPADAINSHVEHWEQPALRKTARPRGSGCTHSHVLQRF